MSVYQPTISLLVLQESKGSEYLIAWKSKELSKTEIYLLHNDLLLNVKRCRHKIGKQFNDTPLVIDRYNYVIKTVNAYTFYDLDYWPINFPNKFVSKICLFGATNRVWNKI